MLHFPQKESWGDHWGWRVECSQRLDAQSVASLAICTVIFSQPSQERSGSHFGVLEVTVMKSFRC